MGESIESRLLHGRYKVQRQLAKKAARLVLLARDLETQELVVVKLLLFGSEFEWQDYKLFERGAQALQALSHPAIPRYLNYFELDLPEFKGFALVQSYIEAKSLQEHLKAGRTFSETEVKQLAKALLEILMYLHERQPPVIHRDIKPSNILLGDRSGNSVGQVYLVDFDSVQTLAREVGTRTVVGTYGYMPPEQFGGRAVPASDLYGLGATLIYLVTGRDPADLPQIDLRIQFEQAANLSPALTSWLKWMTQPSLDKRLSSAQQARQALEKPQSILKDTASTIYVNAARPESTKIFLHKDANYLKISIPAMELQYGKANFWLSLIAFVIGLPFFLMGLLAILIPVLFLLVSLLTLNIGGLIGSLIFSFLFTPIVGFFFGILGFIAIYPLLDQLYHGTRSTRICIDKQEISLTYKFWIFRVTRTVKRQDIIELLVRAMSNPSAWKKRDIYTWFTSNTITLQGRKERFHIRKYPGLTEAELYWLADELSTWLNVPLTKACFQTITTTK